ncbi:MAG: hypothetical protein ACFE9L_13505 [Candidatus Hodarchaeota archaeon]
MSRCLPKIGDLKIIASIIRFFRVVLVMMTIVLGSSLPNIFLVADVNTLKNPFGTPEIHNNMSNQPIIISSNLTKITDGTYVLISNNNVTQSIIILPQYKYNYSDLTMIFSFKRNVTISVSFSLTFPGYDQILNTDLEIAALPITINSSEFEGWELHTSYRYNWYRKDSVVYYHVTSTKTMGLKMKYGSSSEFVSINEFVGNGTYVLLGEPQTPPPIWESPWFIVILGGVFVQILIIGLIGYFIIIKLLERKSQNNR